MSAWRRWGKDGERTSHSIIRMGAEASDLSSLEKVRCPLVELVLHSSAQVQGRKKSSTLSKCLEVCKCGHNPEIQVWMDLSICLISCTKYLKKKMGIQVKRYKGPLLALFFQTRLPISVQCSFARCKNYVDVGICHFLFIPLKQTNKQTNETEK